MRTPAMVGLAIGLLWVAAAGLASRMPLPDHREGAEDPASADMVSRLFGSSREVISQQLFLEADRYFHKGVGHVHERAFANHPYLRWAEAITPTEHSELRGDDVAEIMPWLRMATRADPGNIQAYTTAAYWLGIQGRVEAARSVLDEARSRNPGDYRVSLALGQLLYNHEQLSPALEALERARDQWPSHQDAADKQTQLDLAAILCLEAGIHELQGNQEQAIVRFREILDRFPNRNAVRDRLNELETGGATEDAGHFLGDQMESISSAGDELHVQGGGHVHDEDCDHEH